MPSELAASAATADGLLRVGAAAELSPLAQAVLSGQLPLVAQLLNTAHGTDVNAQDSHGRTPLLIACYQGWLDGTRLLLRHGARRDLRDRSGRLPIHAVTYSHCSSTLTAIAEGCSKAELNAVDGEIMTAVHWAAFHGSPGILAQLLDYGVDAFALDVDSKTALHWASQNNCVTCVDILLRHDKAGEKLIAMQDAGGKTALHCAAAAGSSDAIRRLAQSRICELDSKDNDRRTPLHWAGGIGRTEAVSLLLDLGADALAVDVSGKTPHDYATDAGHTECCSVMEHWARRKLIESTTRKWSQKIEAAQAIVRTATDARSDAVNGNPPVAGQMLRQSPAAAATERLRRLEADAAASTGSVNSTRPLVNGGHRHDKHDSTWSMNLSTLSLDDATATIKAEADLWARLGALDIAKPNATFQGQPKGLEKRRLAPLRVSHQNLAFLASHGHGLDHSPPSSTGSLSTLNSLLAPDARQHSGGSNGQAVLSNNGEGIDSLTKQGSRVAGIDRVSLDRESSSAKPAGAAVDESGWPSVESLTDICDPGARLVKQPRQHKDATGAGSGDQATAPDTELNRLQNSVEGAGREGHGSSLAFNVAVTTIKELQVDQSGADLRPGGPEAAVARDKPKKKVSRAKRKVYPAFEKPEDIRWPDNDDPTEILKYITEATDSTSL